ncbi:hypothetical protein PN441_06575 [Spirulina major CS-329]|nr:MULTISPECIES: hypothetical protein [Spirulina]MDB9494632.1 hypothetical protein [Spirulina subsalsa CS-330]MDB9502732.1 hypothetical protein [Spirulina major CS-329]
MKSIVILSHGLINRLGAIAGMRRGYHRSVHDAIALTLIGLDLDPTF